jgi:hypothetical protein
MDTVAKAIALIDRQYWGQATLCAGPENPYTDCRSGYGTELT